MDIQLIVPVYNEAENVLVLYQALRHCEAAFDSLTFIYDLDEDTSFPFITELMRLDPRVSASKNCLGPGVLNALRWGFSKTRPGPVLVLMSDNSDQLTNIPEMVRLWAKGAVLVCPSRYMLGGRQHGAPFIKSLLARTQGAFLKLCGFPISDPTNNFKLYDGTWLASQTIESTGGFEMALELCYKAYREGKLIVELPTEWRERTLGKSKFKFWAWLPRYLHWYFLALFLTLKRRVFVGRPCQLATKDDPLSR